MILFITSVVLFSSVPFIIILINRRRDETLLKFYKACDEIRNHIHSCNSSAESKELMDELAFVRDSYVDIVPPIVLDKELKLLGGLLNKKSKKLK